MKADEGDERREALWILETFGRRSIYQTRSLHFNAVGQKTKNICMCEDSCPLNTKWCRP